MPPPRASRTKYDCNFAKAKELLKEGGYDGTPVVLMHSTDLYDAGQPGAGGQVS